MGQEHLSEKRKCGKEVSNLVFPIENFFNRFQSFSLFLGFPLQLPQQIILINWLNTYLYMNFYFMNRFMSEWGRGMAFPRVLEGCQDFGVKCGNVSEYLWKVLKKSILNPENWKKGSALPFLMSFFRHLRKNLKY